MEPSEIPLPQTENQPIEEIDLTGLQIGEVQQQLSELLLSNGHYEHLLHGTTHPDLTDLVPQESVDTFEHKGTATGVFATDQPLIALARGAAGKHLSIWTRQVLFGYTTLPDFSIPGYLYLLPRKDFMQHPNDLSEYVSTQNVTPTKKIIFDSLVMQPFLRSSQEVYDAVDQETGLMKTDMVRGCDITAGLLTLRNLITLSGNLGYTTESSSLEMEYFRRIDGVMTTLDPVFRDFNTRASDSQKKLASEIHRQFEWRTTGGIYEAIAEAQIIFETIGRHSYFRDFRKYYPQ